MENYGETGVPVTEVDQKIDQNKEINEILTNAPVKDTSSGIFNKILIAIIVGIGSLIVNILDTTISTIIEPIKGYKSYLVSACIVAIIALITLFMI